MHEIKAFKTSDGVILESEVEAARHELTKFIKEWWDSGAAKSSDVLTSCLLEDADAVAQVLNSFIRARGPVKTKSSDSFNADVGSTS